MEATAEVYDYYAGLGCKMDADSPRDKWDGKHGVMIYGRSTEKLKRHTVQPKEEWTVCLGLHEPFMPADKWLAVQERFRKNTFDKKKKYDVPLLKGTLRCAKCGCLMQVSRKKLKNGILSSYYCLTRSRKGVDVCDMGSVKCRILDEKVLDVFRRIEADPDAVMEYASEQGQDAVPEWRDFASEIAPYRAKIARLTAFLSEAEDSPAAKHIIAQIEELDANIEALKREEALQTVEKRRAANEKRSAGEKAAEVRRLMRGLSGFTADEKNEIVKGVVRELTWDGETLFLRL